MGRRAGIAFLVVMVVAMFGSVAGADGRKLSTPLSGTEEVDANGAVVGDPNGTGTARLTLNHGQAEVCYRLTWQNLDGTVQHAHIHEAVAGKNGDVVVTLFANQSFLGTGSANGCDLNDSTKAEVRRILNNPANFYVNIHDTVRPAGAIRGQLER